MGNLIAKDKDSLTSCREKPLKFHSQQEDQGREALWNAPESYLLNAV